MKNHFGFAVLLIVGLYAPLMIFGGCDAPAPADHLYSVPNALLREYDFSVNGLVRVHDYGYGSLVQLASTDGLPAQVLGRISAVDDPAVISYRSFSSRFDPKGPPPPAPIRPACISSPSSGLLISESARPSNKRA